MKKKLAILVAALVLAGAAAAAVLASANQCPGVIECPLTGQPICCNACPAR